MARTNPSDEKIGVVFQNGALFDSLSVWQNVIFANADRGTARKAREIAIEMLARARLGSDVADLRPAEISGGMQKRVALARALARDPQVVLLDSPTAGLDPILTAIIDSLIVASLERLHATALTITHDIESARRSAPHCCPKAGSSGRGQSPRSTPPATPRSHGSSLLAGSGNSGEA